MSVMRKVLPILLILCAACVAYPLARMLAPHVFSALFGRHVDSSRVEGCLSAYQHYQETKNQEDLKSELDEFKTSPREFQQIIDRFIHYRLSKSSRDQAMVFLKAFESGYSMHVTAVHGEEPQPRLPYKLEAEILTVIREKPYLVQRAFGS